MDFLDVLFAFNLVSKIQNNFLVMFFNEPILPIFCSESLNFFSIFMFFLHFFLLTIPCKRAEQSFKLIYQSKTPLTSPKTNLPPSLTFLQKDENQLKRKKLLLHKVVKTRDMEINYVCIWTNLIYCYFFWVAARFPSIHYLNNRK